MRENALFLARPTGLGRGSDSDSDPGSDCGAGLGSGFDEWAGKSKLTAWKYFQLGTSQISRSQVVAQAKLPEYFNIYTLSHYRAN